MKKLWLLAGLLLLPACATIQGRKHLFVNCWEQNALDGKYDIAIYSGRTNGSIGIANNEYEHVAAVTFKNTLNEQVTIYLNNRICVVSPYGEE
jgi:hypothetical protein